jgi:hypothetical protein
MGRIATWSAGALLVIGIGMTVSPSEAQCPIGPCGDMGRVLGESANRAAGISGDDNTCVGACRRLLAGCRTWARRMLSCENGVIRADASIENVLCRGADGGDPKAIRECRASVRQSVVVRRNDREDFLRQFSNCEDRVGTCNCT